MGNAAPGGHQVHRAGGYLERIALAVAMHDAAIEQVGDGGKSDVRVRAHVEPLPSDELNRSHLIEEDEGTDHLALAMRQRAAHREAVAEIAYARNNDELERVTRSFLAEHWIGRGQPAHCSPPCSFDRPHTDLLVGTVAQSPFISAQSGIQGPEAVALLGSRFREDERI